MLVETKGAKIKSNAITPVGIGITLISLSA